MDRRSFTSSCDSGKPITSNKTEGAGTLKHLIAMVVTLAVMFSLSWAGGDGVISTAVAGNAPEGCEKIRGTIYCGPVTENVGNAPEHSNSQETTTTTSKKGSINSSHEEEE